MKRIALAVIFLLFPIIALSAVIGVYGRITTVLKAVTVTGAGDTYQFDAERDVPLRAHKSSIVAGTGTATVLVQVNDSIANPWVTACTLSLNSGTGVTSDSCITNAPWLLMRHNITAISGVTVTDSIME